MSHKDQATQDASEELSELGRKLDEDRRQRYDAVDVDSDAPEPVKFIADEINERFTNDELADRPENDHLGFGEYTVWMREEEGECVVAYEDYTIQYKKEKTLMDKILMRDGEWMLIGVETQDLKVHSEDGLNPEFGEEIFDQF